MDQSILIWGLVIILGFPILALLLIECTRFSERQSSLFTPVLRNIWRYVLPCVAALLVMERLLKLANTQLPVKFGQTAFWLAAMVTLLSLINAALTPKEPKTGAFQFQVPNIFFQAARAAVILLLLAQLLGNTWQIDVGGMVQTLGIGSVVIALALQNTISSLVSGLLLLIAKPFKEGDWIEVDGCKGQVIDINWRAVTITDYFGYKVSLPNGTIANAKIINHDPIAWDYLEIGFSYDDPPNRVIPALEQAVQEVEGIEQPIAGIKSYDDCAITYEVWFAGPIGFSILMGKMELNKKIYYLAKREGFSIPFPIRVMHHRKPEHLQGQNPQTKMLEFMRSLPYLSALESEVMETLVEEAHLRFYGAGETIIQAGEPDEGLYIIQLGQVKLSVQNSQGEEQEVDHPGVGDFFGEMALLPGEVSPVSAIALDDLQAIVINHRSAQKLVDNSPRFAQEMNQFIKERKRVVSSAQGIEIITQSTINGNGGKKLPSLLGKLTSNSDSSAL